MRLFVAVRPSGPACAALAAAAGRPADPRWHVTLAFLGDRPDAEPLVTGLATAAAGHAPLALRLEGGGTFGGRVLWAGLGGQLEALAALADDVRRTLHVGDPRPFHPHLTLARGTRLVVPAGVASHRGPRWQVREVELVRSRLGSRPEHEVLARLPLLRVSC